MPTLADARKAAQADKAAIPTPPDTSWLSQVDEFLDQRVRPPLKAFNDVWSNPFGMGNAGQAAVSHLLPGGKSYSEKMNELKTEQAKQAERYPIAAGGGEAGQAGLEQLMMGPLVGKILPKVIRESGRIIPGVVKSGVTGGSAEVADELADQTIGLAPSDPGKLAKRGVYGTIVGGAAGGLMHYLLGDKVARATPVPQAAKDATRAALNGGILADRGLTGQATPNVPQALRMSGHPEAVHKIAPEVEGILKQAGTAYDDGLAPGVRAGKAAQFPAPHAPNYVGSFGQKLDVANALRDLSREAVGDTANATRLPAANFLGPEFKTASEIRGRVDSKQGAPTSPLSAERIEAVRPLVTDPAQAQRVANTLRREPEHGIALEREQRANELNQTADALKTGPAHDPPDTNTPVVMSDWQAKMQTLRSLWDKANQRGASAAATKFAPHLNPEVVNSPDPQATARAVMDAIEAMGKLSKRQALASDFNWAGRTLGQRALEKF